MKKFIFCILSGLFCAFSAFALPDPNLPKERLLIGFEQYSFGDYTLISGPGGSSPAHADGGEGLEQIGQFRIDYDLGYTVWNSYLAWTTTSIGATSNDYGLSVRLKAPTGATIIWMLEDNTGQIFTRYYTTSGYQFDRLEWIWNSSRATESREQESYSGGANDGVMHLPLARCSIGVCRWLAPQYGSLYLDKVCAVEAPAPYETITVDFSDPIGSATNRASGILHSISTSLPVDADVTPLNPKMFRMRPVPFPYSQIPGIDVTQAVYEATTGIVSFPRLVGLGAVIQPVLSDAYLITYGGYPGDNGDYTTFENMITGMYSSVQSYRDSIQWDIWNEPDYYGFWPRSRTQYYNTWEVGYDKIKSLYANAEVVGPSAANYNGPFLQAFLLEAQSRNALPDILSWHEMGFRRNGYNTIKDHVQEITTFMTQNNISINKISFNEYVGPQDAYSAGAHVAYLNQLEQVQVNSAAHATWNVEAVWGLTLDGMLTFTDRDPTGVWWIYKTYASMNGTIVQVKNAPHVFGVASKDSSAETALILIGRDAVLSGDVKVNIVGLSSASYLMNMNGKMFVRCMKIANTDGAAANAPVLLFQKNVEVEDGEIAIDISGLGLKDACYIELSAP